MFQSNNYLSFRCVIYRSDCLDAQKMRSRILMDLHLLLWAHCYETNFILNLLHITCRRSNFERDWTYFECRVPFSKLGVLRISTKPIPPLNSTHFFWQLLNSKITKSSEIWRWIVLTLSRFTVLFLWPKIISLILILIFKVSPYHLTAYCKKITIELIAEPMQRWEISCYQTYPNH